MKKVIVMLLAVLFLAQGIVLAEDMKTDIQATAEPVVDEAVVAEEVIDPATGAVEEAVVVAEELVTPPAAPAAETK